MFYTSAQLIEDRGKWKAQLKYKDGDKWRKRTHVLKATGKRAAQAELEAWRDEMEAKAAFGTGMAKRPDNVAEFVRQYIDTLESSKQVEKSTIFSYRAYLKPIEAGLGKIAIEDLDADTVQAWVNAIAKEYAPTSVKRYLNLLKATYKDAVDRRAIPYSPITAVKAPKLTRKEPNALDPQARQRLLSYLEIAGDTPVNLAIKLALVTGMREGEICGLQWRNVDLKAGVLRVRTVIGRDGGQTYVKEPKTGGSRRDIPLTAGLARELKRRRTSMMEECMEAGVAMAPTLYVFGQIDGTYMNPHELWRSWKAIAKSLGLVGTEGKAPTFHDLRHTFATAAIASGADVKSVSSILGHTNAAMTLNIYATADAEAKRRTMEGVSRAIAETPREAEILALGKTGTED